MFHEHIGFVGNIWVRQNYLELAGDTSGGHAHTHDHITLLTTGSVEVVVGEYPPKVFVAPTFIVIIKGLKHRFTALEDKTNWYCVFALRDVDGDQTDIADEAHLPVSLSTEDPTIYKKFIKFMELQNNNQQGSQ